MMRFLIGLLSIFYSSLHADSWEYDASFINKLTQLASEQKWSEFDSLSEIAQQNKNCFQLSTLANAFSGAEGTYPRTRDSMNKSVSLHILAMESCDDFKVKRLNANLANNNIPFVSSNVDEADIVKNKLYKIYRQNPGVYANAELYLKLITNEFDTKDLPKQTSRLGINFDLNSPATVIEVSSNMPGERIGFLSGDVVLKVNDIEIDKYTDFIREFQALPIGQKVSYQILRNNKIINLEGNKPYPSHLEYEKNLAMFSYYYIGNYEEAVSLVDFEKKDNPINDFIASVGYLYGIGVEKNISESLRHAENILSFFKTYSAFDSSIQLNSWGLGMELYHAINWSLVLLGEANVGADYLSEYIEKPDKALGFTYLTMASFFKPTARGIYGLGVYHLKENNYIEAKKAYNYLVNTFPSEKYLVGHSLRDLGFLHKETGDEKKYWDYIEKSADVGNILSSAELGRKLWREKKHAQAEQYLLYAAENSDPRSLAILGNEYTDENSSYAYNPEKGFIYMKRANELGESYMEVVLNMWGAIGDFDFLSTDEKKDYIQKFILDSKNGKNSFEETVALNLVGYLTYNGFTGFKDEEYACTFFDESKKERDLYGYFWSTVCDNNGGNPIGYTTQQVEDLKYLSKMGVPTASLYLSEYYLKNPSDRNIIWAKDYLTKATHQKDRTELKELLIKYSALQADNYFIPPDNEFNRLKNLIKEEEKSRLENIRQIEASNQNSYVAKNSGTKQYGFWDFVGDVITIAAVVFVAGEVIDALDDVDFGDYDYVPPRRTTYSDSYSSLSYNEPSVKQTRRADTMSAYLYSTTFSSCEYRVGGKSYSVSKGISGCPINVEVPATTGIFDASQMNYSTSNMKTTWYLDTSRSNSSSTACIYKFGNQSRTIPKGIGTMCPINYQF